MKKTIIILFVTMVATIFLSTSCKRTTVPDPDFIDPAGSRVILTGKASPSTLYIPQTNPPVYSDITIEAKKNDGTPMANFKIIFEQEGWGYFEGFRASDTRWTNGQGIAQIRYWVPAGSAVKTDTLTYIRATLVDDGRFDNPMAQVNDLIPVRIIPYQTQLVCLHGKVRTNLGEGIPNVIMELSEMGGVTLTRVSGSYDICVAPGWAGTITPNLSGYTFIPTNYDFTNSPVTTDLYNLDFYAEGGPTSALTIVPTTVTFATSAAGSSNITVYNSGSTISIPYTISTSETWITIDGSSARSGATEQTHTITVQANAGVARTGFVTIYADDPNTSGSPLVFTVTQAGI